METDDELGRVAHAFNQMAADLSDGQRLLQENNVVLLQSNILFWEGLRRQHKDAEHIQYLAFNDALTGLPNRSHFSAALTQALQRATREHAQFAIFFVDLDCFKQINDTLGYAVGDELLKEVGARLHHALRPADVVARLSVPVIRLPASGVSR